MSFCHIHGLPLLMDPYGNGTCEECARAEKADLALRCRECYTPIHTPGLCPSCEKVAGRRKLFEWLGTHAGWIAGIILLLGVAFLVKSIADEFLPAIKGVNESPAYQVPKR
jgi:uncharacterized membrane protein